MSLIDVKAIEKEAREELNKEKAVEAKEAIKELLQEKDDALLVVANIEREIADALKSISEGNPIQSAD